MRNTHGENHHNLSRCSRNNSEEEPHLEAFESLMYHNVLDLCGRYEGSGWAQEEIRRASRCLHPKTLQDEQAFFYTMSERFGLR